MRLLFALLAVVVVAGCDQKAAGPAARMVSGSEAKAKVAAGATLLDVRTVDEFDELHLEGARNIPLAELGGALESLPKDKPVVVYCAVGGRSAKAAALLASKGYDVNDLGGIGNWKK